MKKRKKLVQLKQAPRVRTILRRVKYVTKKDDEHQAALVAQIGTPWEEILPTHDQLHSKADREYIERFKEQSSADDD